jgi:hypothetical protein
MQRNLSIFKVQIKWAKDEWHVLNSKGTHIQEFDSGFFERYFAGSNKEQSRWFVVSMRKTAEEDANLRFIWDAKKDRWNLFDFKSGRLIKSIFACDKIPLAFPAAAKDAPNFYKFRCQLLKNGGGT